MEQTTAPAIGQTRSARHGGAYPAPGTKLGLAWEHAWKLLQLSGTEYVEGVALSEEVAGEGKVASVTVLNLLARAATAHILERDLRTVEGKRGPRKRTFYRVQR